MLLAQNYFKLSANNNRLGELCTNMDDTLHLVLDYNNSQNIHIFNLLTGKLIYNLSQHTERVTCASLYNQNKLVSGSEDGLIKFWDLQTGKCSKTLNCESVNCLKVLKNEDLATGSGRNSIIIWDMVMFEMKFTLFSNERNKKITCLDQLSNEWLVSGGFDNETIEIWDLKKRVCIRGIYSSNSIIFKNSKAFFKSYTSNDLAGRVTCLQAFEKTIDGKIEYSFAAGTHLGDIGIWNA